MEKSSLDWSYPMSPSPSRGMPLHLSANSKKEKFSYPSQDSAVLREVNNLRSGYTAFQGHAKNVTMVACSPVGDRVISGDETGYLNVWNADHPTLMVSWEMQGLAGAIHDGSFNDEGDKAVFVGESTAGKYGRVINVSMKKTDAELVGHTGRALSCAFKPNRPFKIFTASEDNTVNTLALPGWSIVKIGKEHKGFVNCVRVSPDGKLYLSAGADKHVQLYSVETGELLRTFENAHAGSIYSATWFEDSRRFATCSADKTLKLFNVEGETLVTLSVAAQPAVDDMQMGVVKLKGHLISVSLSGTLNVWNDASLVGTQALEKPDQVVFGHNVGSGHARNRSCSRRWPAAASSPLTGEAECVRAV